MMNSSATADNTWTHVAARRRPEPMGWGTPTIRTPAPAASNTRPGFSFSSAATVAALDGKTPTKKPSATPWKTATAPPSTAKQPDMSSMRDFPTLGGGSAARPTMVEAAQEQPSWARTVKEMAAREDAPAEEGPYLRRRHAIATPAAPSHRSRLAMIGTRCFDDGPADYDGPEEDDDGAGSYREDRAGTPVYDAEGEEVNANLAVTRRAGDKSDW